MNNTITKVVAEPMGVRKENEMNAREIYLKDLSKRREARELEHAKNAKYAKNTTKRNTSTPRVTLIEVDYTVKPQTIKMQRLDNGYRPPVQVYQDKTELHKMIWKFIHSPRVLGLVIKSKYLSKDIKSLMSYCNMENIACTVIDSKGAHYNTRKELDAWSNANTINSDEGALRDASFGLIKTYAKELMPFINSPVLPQLLKDIMIGMDYDANMSTRTYSEGLNHGTVETAKGKEEWSRTYTKHYKNYAHVDPYTGKVSGETLYDLLNVYICYKYYKANDIPCEELWKHGISTSDIDSYTGEPITEPVRIHFDREDEIVVPISACGEGLQMLLD